MNQRRNGLLNVESVGEIFLSSAFGDYNGGPVKILASYPITEDVTANLGEYESEARAMEILEEIAGEYEKGEEVEGTVHPEYGYVNCRTIPLRKVYKMPES